MNLNFVFNALNLGILQNSWQELKNISDSRALLQIYLLKNRGRKTVQESAFVISLLVLLMGSQAWEPM